MDIEISYRIVTCGDNGFFAEDLDRHIEVYGATVNEALNRLFHKVMALEEDCIAV